MSKKSKCTYKRKRFDNIEDVFNAICFKEKRVSIKYIIGTKQKVSFNALHFIASFAKKRDMTQSSAIEKIIKEFVLFGFEINAIEINDKESKIKNYKIHPAYIDIIKHFKVQHKLSWTTTFEQIILNYKKNMNFL